MKNPAALPGALPDIRENGPDRQIGSAADFPVSLFDHHSL